MNIHFPSEKLILPYFSTPRGVAILVCDSHRQAGSSTLEEPGGNDVPGWPRQQVGETNDKVGEGLSTLPAERMASRDVLLRHSDASLGVERPEAGLQVGLVFWIWRGA